MNIVQSNFHLLWGGQAEVVLASSLELKNRGHRVIVACPPDSELDKRSKAAGLGVFTGCRFLKGFRPISIASDTKALGKLFVDRKIDIHHAHGSQDHWAAAVAVWRSGAKTKIVRSRHNVYPVKNHMFNRWLFRDKTAATIATAIALKERFTSTGLLQDDQIDVVHSPLPAEFEAGDNPAPILREELNIADDELVVGFTANFHPDKAPLILVEAAPEIFSAVPNSKLILIGHGPLEDNIRARMKELKIEDRIFLPGFRPDIRNVMAGFDVFVLPSVTREASSTVLKMAGTLRIPSVTTDIGGSAEIVADGVTGKVVTPKDQNGLAKAIIDLLRDSGKRKTMGQAARKKVLEEFTVSALVLKLEAIYQRLASA